MGTFKENLVLWVWKCSYCETHSRNKCIRLV